MLHHRVAQVVLLLGLASWSARGSAQTMVPAGTLGNTTWTAAGSPYILAGQLEVTAGATLHVEAGATVQLHSGLLISGTLLAMGTAAAPVSFTGTTQTPGAWNGITIQGAAASINTGSVLDHVTLSYGGWSGGSLILSYAHATVSNCEIRDGRGDGIHGNSGGVADVSDTVFTNNEGYAIKLDDGSLAPVLRTLSATGNGHDRIAFGGGTTSGVRRFEAILPYDFLGAITVPEGAEVVFAPGVSAYLGHAFTVNGTFTAVGTSAQPITLAGLTATPGAWNGIDLAGDSSRTNTGSRIEHVKISDSGWSGGSIMLHYAQATIVSVEINNGRGDGIHGYSGGIADVQSSTISGNEGYAIKFDDGSLTPMLASITASGNGFDRIGIGGGTLSGMRSFDNVLPYDFLAALTVAPGAQVVLQPGISIRLGHAFDVRGTLIAIGTETQPILLSGLTPEPGAWNGINFIGTSTQTSIPSRLEHVMLESSGWSGGSIMLRGARVTIRHSEIRKGRGDGIHGYTGGSADVSDLIVTDNEGYALRFDDADLVPTLSGITASGNGFDQIAFGSINVYGSRVFENILPYAFMGSITVPEGAELKLAPGVRFLMRSGFEVAGTLLANGTQAQPVTLTGLTPELNAWNGLTIKGTEAVRNEGSRLEHVNFEYGGWSAATLMLTNAKVHVSNCRFTKNGHDAVQGRNAGGTLIELSAFVDIGGDYAVRHTAPAGSEPIWAINDWWGAAAGPRSGDVCRPGGSGAQVSEGVAFVPFLTSSDTDLGPVAPLGMLNMSLTPLRWFVPADGSSRAHVKIGLRDGNGVPVSGRTVTLRSSLGQVTAGGMTDINGESFAWVTSNAGGDAVLTSALAANSVCEVYRPVTSTITFTAEASNPLMPEVAAPYLADEIQISPLPIVQGVPTIASARLTNPNDFPIAVDADFGFAQLGIGLTFGPFGTVTGQVIPAHSDGLVQATWAPNVSGHYCIQVHYSYQAATHGLSSVGTSGHGLGGSGSGGAQRNIDVKPGCQRDPGQEDSIDKAKKVLHGASYASKSLNGFEIIVEHGHVPSPFWVPEQLAEFIPEWILEQGRTISDALQGCTDSGGGGSSELRATSTAIPIDYRSLPRIRQVTLPQVVAGTNISAALADAHNAWIRAAVDAFLNLEAMADAERKQRAASAAYSLEWASQQAAAYSFYQARAGHAFVAYADASDALLAVLRSQGTTSGLVSAADWRAYQDHLRTAGVSETSRQAAQLLGFDAAAIERHRQTVLAYDPNEMAGDALADFAAGTPTFRRLGEALLAPPSIQPNLSVSGSHGLAASSGNLAQLYPSHSTIEVGNPLATAATIKLRVRRLDLPSDWTVRVSPTELALEPGTHAPVTVEIDPGTPVAQGTQPRVAIEALAADQLLGGVVVDTMVPRYVEISTDCKGLGDKALGDPCACNLDCASGAFCADLGSGARQCATSCDLTAPACPLEGQPCLAWAGPGGVCGPAPEPAAAKGCGCNSAGTEASSGWFLLALIVLWGLRAQRPRSDYGPLA